MNSPNQTTNISQNTQPTVKITDNNNNNFKSSPRNPNNNERKMVTPPTYLVDKKGLWRPNATEGRDLMRDYKNEPMGGKTKRKSTKKRKTNKSKKGKARKSKKTI